MKKDRKGHIAIHRSILDNWVWSKGPKSVFEAWVYILIKANWQENKIKFGDELLTIHRGQFFTSQQEMAMEFRWDRKKVKSFLDLLIKDEMIILQTTTKYSLITICKYESYQTLGTSDTPSPPHQLPQVLPTTNNYNNYNKEYIMSVVSYLNEKTGKDFKPDSKKTVQHINARISEKYLLEDFKSVIDCKVSKWLNDPKMSEYLRPETLFGNKFEGYLNECKTTNVNPVNYVDHHEYIFGTRIE